MVGFWDLATGGGPALETTYAVAMEIALLKHVFNIFETTSAVDMREAELLTSHRKFETTYAAGMRNVNSGHPL